MASPHYVDFGIRKKMCHIKCKILLTYSTNANYHIFSYSFCPWIVSEHLCTVTFGFMYCDLWISKFKKNSFCRNYMKKCGIWIVDLRGKGSVYRKIFWARPIFNFSISLPVGTLKLEIYPTQKIFRYTDPFPFRSIQYWTSYFSQPKNRMDYSFITLSITCPSMSLGTFILSKLTSAVKASGYGIKKCILRGQKPLPNRHCCIWKIKKSNFIKK